MSTPETEVIDVEAQEVGAELTVGPPAPTTLFRTDDPAQVLTRATEVANALADVIRQRGLSVKIQGKDHVLHEGWLTLGAMLGVTPACEWTRPIESPAKGWEARFVVRTLDGREVGSAESMCLRSETRWSKTDEYAIRSMAQTRASSKALASVLRFVVTLAGYSGTPADEMPSPGQPQAVQATKPPANGAIDAERVESIIGGFRALKVKYREINLMLGAAGIDGLRANSAKAIEERLAGLTPEQADALEAEMEREAVK